VLVFPSPKAQAEEAQVLPPVTELVNATVSGALPDCGVFVALKIVGGAGMLQFLVRYDKSYLNPKVVLE
jgi:hypothetical protein